MTRPQLKYLAIKYNKLLSLECCDILNINWILLLKLLTLESEILTKKHPSALVNPAT